MDLRRVGVAVVAEGRAVRAAYPDPAGMAAVPPSVLPDTGVGLRWLALRYLWDEVRAGTAGGLTVLDDELTLAEQALADPA